MNEIRHIFHHSDFSDLKKLMAAKEKQGLSISLALPTLNEEKTIGKEILIIKSELMDRYPILDEIMVIDSGSTDKTREVAAAYGAHPSSAQELRTHQGYCPSTDSEKAKEKTSGKAFMN